MPEADGPKGIIRPKEVAYLSTQIGFSVAITTVIFVVGGRYLDDMFHTNPLFTLLGIVLGLAGSLGLVWQIVRPFQKKYQPDWKSLKKTDKTEKTENLQ
mgnify:CR=1 FL=1